MLLVVATSLPPEEIASIAARTVGLIPAGEAPPPVPGIPDVATLFARTSARAIRFPRRLPGPYGPRFVALCGRGRSGPGRRPSPGFAPSAAFPLDAMPAVEVWNAALSSRDPVPAAGTRGPRLFDRLVRRATRRRDACSGSPRREPPLRAFRRSPAGIPGRTRSRSGLRAGHRRGHASRGRRSTAARSCGARRA